MKKFLILLIVTTVLGCASVSIPYYPLVSEKDRSTWKTKSDVITALGYPERTFVNDQALLVMHYKIDRGDFLCACFIEVQGEEVINIKDMGCSRRHLKPERSCLNKCLFPFSY